MGSEKARAEYDEFEQYRMTPYWRERVRGKKKDFYRVGFSMGFLSQSLSIPLIARYSLT